MRIGLIFLTGLLIYLLFSDYPKWVAKGEEWKKIRERYKF